MDAPGLTMTYSPARGRGNEAQPAAMNFAEAAIRVLGACLLLYQQYVPQAEYYQVHHTAAN
jgi:hypothetical protein